MEPNLREAAKWAEREKWRKIRLAKIGEIMKVRDDLIFIRMGEDAFKTSPFSDYSSFEKIMRQGLEEARQRHPLGEDDFSRPPAVLADQLDRLLRLDYEPPQAVNAISIDLTRLEFYYRSDLFYSSIERALDLSLCKLIRSVCRLIGATRARGETTLTGRKKQNGILASIRDVVSAAFYDLKIKNNPRYTSKRQIAQKIRSYLSGHKELLPEGQKDVPSERTIMRHIESDEKVRNDLIAMGVIKDKPTLVQ